jgi:hypothetical protein
MHQQSQIVLGLYVIKTKWIKWQLQDIGNMGVNSTKSVSGPILRHIPCVMDIVISLEY